MDRRSPKSSMLYERCKSMSPKSPMFYERYKAMSPKSPMFNERYKSLTPKSPLLHDRYKSGCTWALISFFGFRRNRFHKKLISDKKGSEQNAIGDGYRRESLNWHSNHEEKRQESDGRVDNLSRKIDSGKAEVEKIAEEETSTEQQINKKFSTAKVQSVQSDSELVSHLPKNYKKAMKTSKKSFRIAIHGCYDVTAVGCRQPSQQNLSDEHSRKFDTSGKVEVQHNNHADHKNRRDLNDENIGCDRSGNNLQTNEVVEAFVNKKLIDGKCLSEGWGSHQSKHFLDALEILNSNKELFVNLLQDPNSLLVEHIENLRDSQIKDQRTKSCAEVKLSEHQKSKSYDLSSIQDCPDDNGHSSSSLSHSSSRSKGTSRETAYFSFQHMKRKLRQAMSVSKREQPRTSLEPSNKFQGLKHCDVGGTSKYADSEKRTDEICQEKDLVRGREGEIASTSESGLRNSKPSELEIHLTPRARSFGTLNNENEEFLRKRIMNTRRKILSLPEYEFLLSVPAQMRYCPYNYHPMLKENKWRARKEKKTRFLDARRQSVESAVPQANDSISGNSFSDTRIPESICTSSEHSSTGHRDFVEKTSGTITRAEINPQDPADVNRSSETNKICVTENLRKEIPFEHLSILDSPIENLASPSLTSPNIYPSSPPLIEKTEDLENIQDRTEHPSPVSVLEPVFREEITSPAEPHVEEHHNPNTSVNDYEAFPERARTSLEASEFTWEEFVMNCHSSNRMFDQLWFDELRNSSHQTCDNHSLVYDYINEVFQEVYHRHFRCSPWMSLIKPDILPVAEANNVVREVMESVGLNVFSCQPPPGGVDQLVEKDLAKSRMWMDIRIDTEDTVNEIVDGVLEEMVMQTANELLQI